ncbi:MAG: cell division protein ZapD [Gallionellaceae bacterium]
MISYEFPLNERVRTLLRLEDLFSRVDLLIKRSDSTDHHAALCVLFEILEVASRADLKSDLLQELERQRKVLAALHNNPAISVTALEAILTEIDRASTDLLSMSGKIGQHLRDNEWLMSIKQRTSIPGGVCEFDLPSYHYWKRQHEDIRRQHLLSWLNPLLPLHAALEIVLRLLRESDKVHHFTAVQGSFQQMQGGKVAQMIRIMLEQNLPCIPEVSANKYALNIRFVTANYAAKTSHYDQDVPFDLTFCSL